jgi:hypothetical protein
MVHLNELGTHMNVANIILQQLGGNKFIVMTGAKNLMSYGDQNALSFRLPSNFAKDKINFVKISLTADDLYTVEFKYIRGMKVADVSEHKGIYADTLQNLFTTATGLDTHL